MNETIDDSQKFGTYPCILAFSSVINGTLTREYHYKAIGQFQSSASQHRTYSAVPSVVRCIETAKYQNSVVKIRKQSEILQKFQNLTKFQVLHSLGKQLTANIL